MYTQDVSLLVLHLKQNHHTHRLWQCTEHTGLFHVAQKRDTLLSVLHGQNEQRLHLASTLAALGCSAVGAGPTPILTIASQVAEWRFGACDPLSTCSLTSSETSSLRKTHACVCLLMISNKESFPPRSFHLYLYMACASHAEHFPQVEHFIVQLGLILATLVHLGLLEAP